MLKTTSAYSQFPDPELFSRFKEDDSLAFQELYKRHWPDLVNAAYKRLNSRQKAEDIVQNIFMDLYQRRAGITLQFSLKAYLSQALKFKILNEYRSELVRHKFKQSLFFNDFCKNDFASRVEAKELDEKINKTLNELPEKCRQVFILSRKENLSNKEISLALRITVSTVEKHISKALKSLRCQLEEVQ